MLLTVGFILCLFCIESRKGKMIYRNRSPPIDLNKKIQIDWRIIKWTNVLKEERISKILIHCTLKPEDTIFLLLM